MRAKRPMCRLPSRLALGSLFALAVSAPVAAQDYPSRPVTFVTPAAAGNSPDVITRVIADKLTQLWKQQVVVINRPGAGGLIAAQAAAALRNDGYSLYLTQASTYTVLPIQQGGKMPVDLHKAFVPVGMVGEQPIALGVQKDVAAQNVAELVALANNTPDGLLFAATNRGGQSHLTGELFRDRANANISFVHSAGELADDCRDRAGRRVDRLDRDDGTDRRARRDHPQAQHGPARNRRASRCAGAPASARHPDARSFAGRDRGIHSQRGEAVVADRRASGAAKLAALVHGEHMPGAMSMGRSLSIRLRRGSAPAHPGGSKIAKMPLEKTILRARTERFSICKVPGLASRRMSPRAPQ
jgi:hypothetical protein